MILFLVIVASASIAGALLLSWNNRRWQADYDDLTERAASYIEGLERLAKVPDAYVQDIADRALKGLLGG